MNSGFLEQASVVAILLLVVMFWSFELAIDDGKSVTVSCRQALVWGFVFVIYVCISYACF